MSDKASGATGGTMQGGNAASHSGGGAGAADFRPASSGEGATESSAASLGGAARERAAHAVNAGKRRVKTQAEELMEAAQERAKRAASEQKDAAAVQIGCVARGLRRAADEMGEEADFAGRYARSAAERLERLSTDLRDSEFDDLIERTEDYARRNPALFIGGAVAAGFLFARFLKSSGRRPDRGATGSLEPAPAGYGAARAEL